MGDTTAQRAQFVQFALEQGVLRFGEFKVKSGRLSPYFFNAGLFNTGATVAKLAQFYAQALVSSGVQFDMLFGPAYKGIPLSTATACALVQHPDMAGRDVPFAFNRKEAKDHGEGGTLVGAPLQGKVSGAACSPPEAAPSFAFRPGDEAERGRRARRRRRQQARAGTRRTPWISRTLAALLAVTALVLGGLLVTTRGDLAEAEEFTDTWTTLSLTPEAQLVPGLSDNGTWQAVIAEDGVALRAEGVAGWDGEVLELWGETDGVARSLGVLDLSRDGEIAFTADGTADRLLVTREMAPGSGSGSPSPRVVATLDPGISGI